MAHAPEFSKLESVLVALRNKRELGHVTEIISKSRYLVQLDSGKIVERHINHIWEGGSTPVASTSAISYDWMCYEPHLPISTMESQPESHPATLPEIQELQPEPKNQPAISETSLRLVRTKTQPRRLILDPKAKSYING